MRIPFSFRLLGTVLAVSAATAGAAQTSQDHNRFKWRDAQGNLHYSDAVPAEAVKFGYDIVNPQGIVVKHVERARTDAELAAAKVEATKQAAERRITEQRARDDEQLMSNYPREEDLKHAQLQELEMLEQQVKSAATSLRNQEQSLADLLDRAAEAERTGKELPSEQTKQLARMRKQVDDQRATVAQREHERDEAASHFDEQVTHYRDLKAKLNPQAVQQP